MDIIHPDKHTFSLVKSFIEPYEEKCVLLSSYVRKESDKIYILLKGVKVKDVKDGVLNGADGQKGCSRIEKGTFVNVLGQAVEHVSSVGKNEYTISSSDILGVLYIDSTLFHCIPEENLSYIEKSDSYKKDILNFFANIMKGKKIKCISGESKGTDFFIRLFDSLSKKPYQINNYKIMTIKGTDFTPVPLSNGDEIIRCTGNDIDELFNIQKKYLCEEVAPKGKVVTDLEVSMTLRQILKNQLCLAVVSDNEIVAKANTNAIGINWIQIGGVYTHPLYRRNGYAINLIYTICKRALKVNKKVSLFVKEKNIPAICLYKELGFNPECYYKIAYFN